MCFIQLLSSEKKSSWLIRNSPRLPNEVLKCIRHFRWGGGKSMVGDYVQWEFLVIFISVVSVCLQQTQPHASLRTWQTGALLYEQPSGKRPFSLRGITKVRQSFSLAQGRSFLWACAVPTSYQGLLGISTFLELILFYLLLIQSHTIHSISTRSSFILYIKGTVCNWYIVEISKGCHLIPDDERSEHTFIICLPRLLML